MITVGQKLSYKILKVKRDQAKRDQPKGTGQFLELSDKNKF